MIVVSGTGRSGTSLWMQILGAAGLPLRGDVFPEGWERFASANPRGYFESSLVEGLTARAYSGPPTRELAVKVLLRGIPLSRLVHLDAVVVSVRHWRGYAGSMRRAKEIFGRALEGDGVDPCVKWWLDHAMFIEDALMRGYPFRFVSFEATLERPEEVLPSVLSWLGLPCDERTLAAVEPALWSRSTADLSAVPARWAERFDELYDRMATGAPLDDSFLARMRAFQEELLEELARDGRSEPLDRWASRRGR